MAYPCLLNEHTVNFPCSRTCSLYADCLLAMGKEQAMRPSEQENDDFFEALAEQFILEVVTDDMAPCKKGKALLEAYAQGDMKKFLLAACGWDISSLLDMVKKRMEEA